MKENKNVDPDIQNELNNIVHDIFLLSTDTGKKVEEILQVGLASPLNPDETARLLTKIITVLRKSAIARGDEAVKANLAGDIEEIVEKIITVREKVNSTAKSKELKGDRANSLKLVPGNGVEVSEVHPTPWFHGREVRMIQGYLRTKDVKLWGENDRLEIQLQQFKQLYNREPTSQELHDIMLSKVSFPGVMELPGISKDEKEDMFGIKELARSIATNGVQRPPILDYDFTLIDGNRRVAACQYILASDGFDLAAKERAKDIYVWQLTKSRTEDDLNNVIVALNFEPPYKKDWPPYIKIRRVYDAFREMMLISPNIGEKGQLEIRRSIAEQFALELDTITRYIRMARMVDEFEEYQINDKNRDEFEVKHRTNRYIQYFDELTKGTTPGTVLYELDRDRSFKNLVFDLLYNGTFENYAQIRNLRYIYDNKEGRETLIKARDTNDPALAGTYFDDAMVIARTAQAEKRELGANAVIERFVKFLEELPPRAFRDVISRENLERLLAALELVEPIVKELLGKK